MRGVILVLAALAGWSLLLVISRVILVNLGLDPWLFTFIQMMASGVFLLFLAGLRHLSPALLRDRTIWMYGILRVLTAAFFTAALLYTSAANAAFMSILSVPTSIVFLWLVLSRIPRRWEVPGHVIIVLGLLLLATQLEGGWRNPAIILMILSELCVVGSTVIAELHPTNNTRNWRQRAELTGLMLLASATVMLLAALGLGVLVQVLPVLGAWVPGQIGWLENPQQALDPVLWISAIAVGVVLRGPSMFLALAAINAVRTENYLAGLAALPLTALLFEAAAGHMGWLPNLSIWTLATAFGGVMVVGSLWVVIARTRPVQAKN